MGKTKDEIIAQLQAENETLKSIIYKLPGHVYARDKQGRYIICNDNVLWLLHLTSHADIQNKTDAEVMDEATAKRLRALDLSIMQSGQGVLFEELGFNQEGESSVYLTHKVPLLNQKGKTAGVLGISLDISERKRMEKKLKEAKQKAEAANKAKSQFLAMISHELRTPLASILGFARLLEKENLTAEKKKEYNQYILHSGTYLTSLINNLLDYSRLHAKKFALTPTPLNFKKFMENVINMLSGTAKLKKIDLLLNYDKTAPQEVIVDGNILQQVLINLLTNAIKFTAEGYVQLNVLFVKKTAEIAQFLISVADSGIGIEEKQQKLIFKSFYQVSCVYTRESSLMGAGLGLAIVKKLLKLLGSKIKLKSAPNQGSTFSFTLNLPLRQSEEIKLVQPAKKKSVEKIPEKLALLVEDNNFIQIIHKEILEELGCKVHIAESATEAIKMLTNDYAFLFVDIGLPDIDGIELIKKIRQENLIAKSVPIITITGYSEEKEHQHCLDAGANEVITKPASKTIFENVLGRYVLQ